MSKALSAVMVIVTAVVGWFSFWYLVPRATSFGMFEGDNTPNITRLALSFSATIAGVVIGSTYRQLRALQAAGLTTIPNARVFLSDLSRSIDLWLGLVGAPIVYALLLQSTDGMSLPGLLLVALENGFCCLLIVNAFVGRTETELKKAAAGGAGAGAPSQQQGPG
jgi:hypothetical protein